LDFLFLLVLGLITSTVNPISVLVLVKVNSNNTTRNQAGSVKSTQIPSRVLNQCVQYIHAGMADNLDIVEGNLSRDLWKASCWEMAKDVSE